MTSFNRTALSSTLIVLLSFVTAFTPGDPGPEFTPADVRLKGFGQRQALLDNSLFKNLDFRCVGPTVMSGRAVDIDADPNDPTKFYVAYASGGLWKTESNGISFEPLFDTWHSMTIGDIAVDWSHGETIWLGSGENNSSRSSYSGTGIYKSTDEGKSWQNTGLAETHHTGRIVLHPNDPNTVWVAALGHLYSPNQDRGVYKTTDGGTTWNKTLYIDENTGVIDLIIDPVNPDVLYASAWYRTRRAWDFEEGGATSGIYKSTDGGATWTLLSVKESGFPVGEGVGRIGLAISNQNPQILYASLDNQFRRPEDEKEKHALTKEMLSPMTKDAFLKIPKDDIADYLKRNSFPEKYSVDKVIEMVTAGKIEPSALVTYLQDANRQLFDTPVVGAEVYRSTDGGKTWKRTHDDFIDDMFFSYGYYFGEIRIDPQDDSSIYLLGVPLIHSGDGGKTFDSINPDNVHADHHALWLNPKRSGHVISGNDGGVNVSYDTGKNWFKANTPTVGQFYAVAVDDAEPYNVYGGLQDNGVWYGPNTYEFNPGWYQEGHYPYKRILGGDGMQIEIDTRNNNTVYTGFQFGYYYRIDRATGKRTGIKPEHELGDRPFRFNWQTPIHLSRHNQDILYLGSGFLHRSLDRGDTWETISADLTQGGQPGDVPYGTLTSIDESPLKFGQIYAGSDDGLIHLTRDGGNTWERISDGLPQQFWISRVEASHHDVATVYASLNGYRWDHFDAYVYRSTDFGKTWIRIGTDLPAEPVNVVLEDPHNPEVIYVGTDHAAYVSIDGGSSFQGFSGMPHAPVHDMKIQKRTRELVIGTHGRSIYIGNVEHLEALTPKILTTTVHLFDIEPVPYSENWGKISWTWEKANTTEIRVPYFASAPGKAGFRVLSEDNAVLFSFSDEAERGLNYVKYSMNAHREPLEKLFKKTEKDKKTGTKKPIKAADDGQYYLQPGTYSLEISLAGVTHKKAFEIVKK